MCGATFGPYRVPGGGEWVWCPEAGPSLRAVYYLTGLTALIVIILVLTGAC